MMKIGSALRNFFEQRDKKYVKLTVAILTISVALMLLGSFTTFPIPLRAFFYSVGALSFLGVTIGSIYYDYSKDKSYSDDRERKTYLSIIKSKLADHVSKKRAEEETGNITRSQEFYDTVSEEIENMTVPEMLSEGWTTIGKDYRDQMISLLSKEERAKLKALLIEKRGEVTSDEFGIL